MPHMLSMCNGIHDSGVWSEGIIISLFKKGNVADVMLTIIEVLHQIETWVKNNDIISDAQFGFKKGHLYNMGLGGKLWSALRNMYSVVKSCGINNYVLNDCFYCAVGLCCDLI
jgi:hypothetical protein